MQSTNGLLRNGTRINVAVLEDGDLITFGGARGTGLNQAPAPTAERSIYEYCFSSDASPPTQSQSLPSDTSSLDQSQSQSLPSLDPSESA